ncbi:hypothetical protein FPQ18DRAFT_19519 [Pyronema domesticum]|nr:hypothetical protein FPQ18DRAFT_19519 [Pyronema domesticum]
MHELLRWISPLEPQARHQDIRSKRLRDTGNCFLETEDFREWCDGDGHKGHNVFRCYGIPGSGKTVMSSLVIDHLSSRFSGMNVIIAFFYFDYHNQRYKSAPKIINVLPRQAIYSLKDNQEVFDNISRDLLAKKANAEDLSLEYSIRSLSKVLEGFDRVYLCLDALDECQDEHRRQLIQSLKDLAVKAKIFFDWTVLCRSYGTKIFRPFSFAISHSTRSEPK